MSGNDIAPLGTLYKGLGLGPIIGMFKFYGFRLDKNSRNYFVVSFDFVLMAIGLLLAFRAFLDLILSNKLNINHICQWSSSYTVHILVFGLYSRTCARFHQFSHHLQQLGLTVASMTMDGQWPSFVNRLQRNAKVINVLNITLAMCLAVGFAVIYEILFNGQSLSSVIINRVIQVTTFLWIIFAASFYGFFTFLFVWVCKLLSMIVDEYVTCHSSDQKDSTNAIAHRQHKHQKLMALVHHVDVMFSSFMMATLVHELIVIIVCIQMFQSKVFRIVPAPIICLNAVEVVALIVKNVVCSNLNDKLKSSLTLTTVPNSIQDLENCSAEHVHYIMYLNELLINRTELTYGRFFPVRKTFIFTIAGTAFTYALILNGINS